VDQAGGQRRPLLAIGFLVGIIAASIAAIGALLLAVAASQPSIAEELADAIAATTPVAVIEGMILAFGPNAKRLLFAGVLLGQIGLGGLLGGIFDRRELGRAGRIAMVVALLGIVGLVVLPLFGAGLLGNSTRYGAGGTLGALLILGALFVVGYEALWVVLHPDGVFAQEEAAARRRFVRNGAYAIGGLALGIGGFRWLAARLAPPAVAPFASSEAALTAAALGATTDLAGALRSSVPGLPPEITPNDQFYVVTKNVFRDPVVDPKTWQLTVAGLVERPRTYTYDEIRELPVAEQLLTLQCISNGVGGELIGNALWRGVWLADLLADAGVKPDAVDVVLTSADDYTDSIPLEKALQMGTMVAYEMNGVILPEKHGFPARLIVPDIYGMKNAKWLTKIELVGYDFKGYWQNRGWNDTAQMHTTSRIDLPRNDSFLRPGPNYLGGVAVAGQRGISKVEVSTDSGATWAPATFKPALGPFTWVLWLYRWDFPETLDREQILVRATDGTGALQTAEIRDPLPDGSSGYHTIQVRRATA
jgi:DMSO/TMAO reductase YedYZ molybdopterin-dependent catalytic subunit